MKRKIEEEKKETKKVKNNFSETFSLTFGEQAENHVGMQKIGKLGNCGFTCKELMELDIKKEYYDLSEYLPKDLSSKEEASVLVIRNGIELLFGEGKSDELFKVIDSLPVDKKAKMKGKVVNKHARWNNCFGEESQKPNYEEGKGTIIAFKSVPIMDEIRSELPKIFGEKAKNLYAETNRYYDLNECGIGFHGDSERKIVICLRLGASMNLEYQWFQECKPVGERFIIKLNHGDIYVMSEKATGFDWKKKKILTLRHAAGCKKFTEIKKK